MLDAVAAMPAGGSGLLVVPAVVLLLWGERLGRLGLPCAAFVGGVTLAQWALTHPPPPYTIPTQPEIHVGVLMLAGVVGMWCDLLHARLGLALAGAMTGATVAACLLPELTGWAALGGAMVLPWVYETSLRGASSLVGVAALVWVGAGRLLGPWVVVAWALGVLWQLFAGPSTHAADALGAAPKKGAS